MLLLVLNYHYYYFIPFVDSKFLQVSRTFDILTDLYNSVDRIVTIRSLISNASSPLSKLGTVPSAPITTDDTVTIILHRFLSFLARSKYLSLFLLSLVFTQWPTGMAKSTRGQVLFFLLLF